MKTPRPSTLDRKARAIVRKIYVKCVTCSATTDLQWAHVFGGYYNSVRWNPFNYAAQCARCNALHNDNPLPYFRWFSKEYGQKALDGLEFLHANTVKYYGKEYREIGVALDRCVNEAWSEMDGYERKILFRKHFGDLESLKQESGGVGRRFTPEERWIVENDWERIL